MTRISIKGLQCLDRDESIEQILFILKEREDSSGLISLFLDEMMGFMRRPVLDYCTGISNINSLKGLSFYGNSRWWRDDSVFNQLIAFLSRLT